MEKASPLSGQSVVVAATGQVSWDLHGEAAIMSLQQGVYYGLEDVGARVWELVQQPQHVQDIVEALLRDYAVEDEQCQRDVLALLQQLMREGLIEVRDGTPG